MSILDGPGPVANTPAAEPQNLTPTAAPDVLAQPSTAAAGTPATGGFLNELGVDWGSLDVNNEPGAGTHHCLLVKDEIRTKKDQTKSWVFSYKVMEGADEGKIKQDWRPLPATVNGKFASDKDANYARFLKQRLMELGVPEERVGAVRPGELTGTDCYVTIVLKDGYKNVTKVVLASEVHGAQASVSPQAQQVQGLI